jgi:hypothetical protein
MKDQDVNPNEAIEYKKPFFQDVRNQRMIVLAVLTVSLLGLVFTTQRDQLTQLTNAENDEVLQMEDQGFSYAFGTEPNDLGNEIEEFTPASEEELNQLVQVVETDEELISEEGQDLFELLEYDEWNNEGLISSDVVNGLIQSTEVQQ